MVNVVRSAPWKPALRELESILERTTKKFDVLRKIDHSIANVQLNLDQLLLDSTLLLSTTYSIKRYGIFYGIDDQLIPVRQGHGHFDKHSALQKYLVIKKSTSTRSLLRAALIPGDDCFAFLFPIVHGSVVFVILEWPDQSALRSDFRSFARNFAEQIHSFTRYVLYRRQREAQRQAYEAFFDNKLQPSACWAALLATLDLFLPDGRFGPTPAPHIRQLLTYLEGDTALRIAAGEGSHTSSFVLVDESVSGLVLKNRGSDHLLINPEQQSEVYKGYGSKSSRTELAIRLESQGDAVGVINIEHEREHAFSSVYVACMRDAAGFLAPLVAGLQARYESFRKKEIGLLYIFTDMLARMGDTYGHLVSQPMLAARGAVAEIRYLIDTGGNDVKLPLLQEVERLTRAIDELETHSDQFTESLPEFISYGSQPIRLRVESRLKSFKKLAQAENISLEVSEEEPNLCAFASSLFQEHIFNIVNNSFQQIRQHIFKGSMKSGLIHIRIERIRGVTPQAQTTGINFVDVVISDNGGGARKADLKKIGRPGFTTKQVHGSGFGVAAAKEYFESVGGGMKWGNIKNGFKTIIRMQEFTPGVHSETRLIDRIRAEAMK